MLVSPLHRDKAYLPFLALIPHNQVKPEKVQLSTFFMCIFINSFICRGSIIIYRKFIHPLLLQREAEIDELIQLWREQSYQLGIKYNNMLQVQYRLFETIFYPRYTKVAAEKITKTVLQTAISGGNGIISSLQHSYSMNDLRRASLTSEVSEESRAVVPKRTMSMHRRERPHHSQSPAARYERKRTGTVTSRSTSRTNSTEGANKTCSLYGTLPRYTFIQFHNSI